MSFAPSCSAKILYTMAAPAEYGAYLQARITPLMIGIGPVEAGVNLAVALAEMAAHKTLPDVVVSLGSAGSRSLPQAEVFQVTSVSYRDMDVSLLGFKKGCTPFVDLPAEVDLPYRIPGIPEATLSTGASIVTGAAYDLIDADMVDMETFAILRACHKFDVPLIGLRGISDGATELTHLGDWTEYLHVIDEKLCDALNLVDAVIADGMLNH
ncbi:5'-methylthioadenosine/S-adenosylhomocysteine nucleosidase [Thalassospira marina]|uniref:5'-methylthioadenosine/S-adenosylhomocysteine nucleosidase n=1 Tax=Thalassospira marina TaxID=2048283 RepID=A0A2N3KVG2_9PROT|nr:5'-methylthioadenosine/S-adenosylhomocysteine nucleosidase [Thalassospira marina]PKR54571.1 5'-methylthioadenosine/S-adenosylhomocysteine nucleosidase [Thalassospira marina]